MALGKSSESGWYWPMVLAGVIILLGGWLRFCGLDWGLPFLYDPDEPQFASRALAMVAHGKMDPEWYGHPGSTTMYLMALVCGLSTLVGLATGKYESLEAARTIMEYDPSDFYYLGRLVILVFSVGTLILFYKLARRLTGGWTSVLALALLAVFPIHVSISRLIRTDIQATFFILLSLWYCVSIVEHNRLRDYLWAGFFLGLAVVTKYPAAVFSLTVMTAFLLAQVGQPREPVNRFGYLLAGGVSGLVGVVVGSPLLFFRFSQVLHDVGFESRSYHLSATSHGFFDSAHWYLSGPLAAGVTWAGLVLAFHAAVVIVGTRNSRQLLILVSTAAFLVFLSAMKLRWARWVVPLTPLVSLLAAIGFSCFWSWVTTRSRSKWVAGSLVGLALVWTAVPAYDGYLRARALDQASTQTLAWEWIMQNVPPGRSVLQERYTPQLPPDRYDLYWVPEGQIVPMELKSRYVIPQGVIGSLGDVAWIQETGVDYILLGSDYDRRLVEADRYGAEIAVYRYIMERCRLVYEAWPEVGRIDGGPVRIYQVRKARSAGGSPGSGY